MHLMESGPEPCRQECTFFHLSGYVSAFCPWGGWEEWLRLVTHQSEGQATGLVITQHGLHHFHQIKWSGVFPHFGVPSMSSTCERSQKQDNLGVFILKKEGQLHSDHQTKYGIFADQFRSVSAHDREGPNQDTKLHEPACSTIDNLVVNEEGVKTLLLGINPNDVSGLDQIPYRLLQDLTTEMAVVLTNFLHQSLSTGQLIQVWMKAWIWPIFKKGSRCQPENFRPVSLTCITCKLFEHILCFHIRGHLR